MKRNMRDWPNGLRAAEKKRALPILSFPSVRLMGISIREPISDSNLQARGMQLAAEQVNSAAAVSLMDFSAEAECFGAPGDAVGDGKMLLPPEFCDFFGLRYTAVDSVGEYSRLFRRCGGVYGR